MGKYMTDADWKHSKYFRKEEFKCPCGKCSGYPKNGIYKSLVDNMNLLRQIYGQSITITSGYRCADYNKRVGGVADSVHMLGGACDWNFSNKVFTQAQKNEIIAFIKKLPNYSYSYSNQENMYNAIHIDTKLVDCASWVDTSAYEKQIKDLETKLSTANETNDKLKSEVTILQEELILLNEANDNLEEKLEAQKETLKLLEEAGLKLAQENTDLKVENAQLTEEVKSAEKQLSVVIKENEKIKKQLENVKADHKILLKIGNYSLCKKMD